MLVTFGTASAQHPEIASTSVPGRSVVTERPATVTTVGSLNGHIFNDIGPLGGPSGGEAQYIKGVRVILRSMVDGTSSIVGHQISNAAGEYDFPDLRPGTYTVEVDPLSIPAKFRLSGSTATPITINRSGQSIADLSLSAQRIIKGTVFIDKDGDGRYKPGKDVPVAGAYIMTNGTFAVSNVNGSYILTDLPAGRTGLLVTSPKTNDNTHVVLDLGPGPVSGRVVNVSINR